MTKETVKELAQKVGTGYYSTEDDTNYYTVNIRTYTKVPLDKRPEEIHPDFIPDVYWSNIDQNRVEIFNGDYAHKDIPDLLIRVLRGNREDSFGFLYNLIYYNTRGENPVTDYKNRKSIRNNPNLEDLLKHYEILKPQLIEWKKGITNGNK